MAKKGLPEKKKKKLLDARTWERDAQLVEATRALREELGEQLFEDHNIFRERKSRELMLSGVTIRRPETVVIDSEVSAGMDTVIEPFAQLLGRTSIGEDAVIGAGCILKNCQVGDRVEISAYTVAQDSRIDAGATIGPFARLRPDNHVEENAHVGKMVVLVGAEREGEGRRDG